MGIFPAFWREIFLLNLVFIPYLSSEQKNILAESIYETFIKFDQVGYMTPSRGKLALSVNAFLNIK